MKRSTSRTGAAFWVPLAYSSTAHLALGSAAAVTLWKPSWIAGFFYHPKMVAVVHNLTLGWISSGLIAILYTRGGLRARAFDVWIFAAWFAGASGLASHFWIEEFSGMTWSAGLLAVSVFLAAGRFGAAVAAGPLPAALKLQVHLGWLNLVATAFIGALLGINRTMTVLPGYSLDNVYAHAHLAAIGWAFLLTVAVGHLGLLEPGDRVPAPGLSIIATSVTQLGAVGLFVSLLAVRLDFRLGFGLTAVAGMLGCLVTLGLHFRVKHRSGPSGWLLLAAGGWLAGAAVIAISIAHSTNAAAPETIMAYGAAGLLGGLGQAVAACVLLDASVNARGVSEKGWPVVVGWLVAVPALVFGLARTESSFMRLGAAALLFAAAWSAWRTLAANRAPG